MKKSRRGPEAPERPALSRANSLELVADRPRRIDAWIDYFGTGDPHLTSTSYDAGGEAILGRRSGL